MMLPVCHKWMSAAATHASMAVARILSMGEHRFETYFLRFNELLKSTHIKVTESNLKFSFALATNVPVTLAGVAKTATSIIMNVNPTHA